MKKYHTGQFCHLHLESDNPGRVQWWNEIMPILDEKTDFFVLKFGYDLSQLGDNEGACGGFVRDEQTAVDFIALPDDERMFGKNALEIHEDGEEVYIKMNDMMFQVFAHEYCHFEHLVLDDGMCIGPHFHGKFVDDDEDSNDNTRIYEYEASYRCIVKSNKYKWFPGDRQLIYSQFYNIFVYDVLYPAYEYGNKEKIELLKLMDACGAPSFFKTEFKSKQEERDHGEAQRVWLIEHCFANYKFSQWADPAHEINFK